MLTTEQRSRLIWDTKKGVILSNDLYFFNRIMSDEEWREKAKLFSIEETDRIKETISKFFTRERKAEMLKANILTIKDHTDTAIEKMGDSILNRISKKILEYLDYYTGTIEEAKQFIQDIDQSDIDYLVELNYKQLMKEYKAELTPRRKQRTAIRTHDRITDYLTLNPIFLENSDNRQELVINHKQQIYDVLEVVIVNSNDKAIQISALDRTILQAMWTLSQSFKKNDKFTTEDIYRAIAGKTKSMMADRVVVKKKKELEQIHKAVINMSSLWVRVTIKENKGTSDKRGSGALYGRMIPINYFSVDYVSGETTYYFNDDLMMLKYATICQKISYIPWQRIDINMSFKNPTLENYILRDVLAYKIDLMYHHNAKPILMFESILKNLQKEKSSKYFKSRLKSKIKDILEDFAIAEHIKDYREINDQEDSRIFIGWEIELSPESAKCFSPDYLKTISERKPEMLGDWLETKITGNNFRILWDNSVYLDYIKKHRNICQSLL